MDTALCIWLVVAIVCVVAFILKVMESCGHRRVKIRFHRIVEIGRESEEIFVPGDRVVNSDCDEDDSYDD